VTLQLSKLSHATFRYAALGIRVLTVGYELWDTVGQPKNAEALCDPSSGDTEHDGDFCSGSSGLCVKRGLNSESLKDWVSHVANTANLEQVALRKPARIAGLRGSLAQPVSLCFVARHAVERSCDCENQSAVGSYGVKIGEPRYVSLAATKGSRSTFLPDGHS
jgi:hypothetical protein